MDEVALNEARAQLARHRLLNADEERALAQRMAAGDREAREQLILHNTRLVYGVARRYYSQYDPALTFDDLVQEGLIGLMRAADKYEWERGNRFNTYALWWIRQAISRAIANSGTIRVSVHVAQGQGRDNPEIEAAVQRARYLVELDAPVRGRDGLEMATVGEMTPSGDNTEAEALNRVVLAQALNGVGDMPRRALLLTLGGETRREIGRQLGLSHGYVWYALTLARRVVGESCPAVGD